MLSAEADNKAPATRGDPAESAMRRLDQAGVPARLGRVNGRWMAPTGSALLSAAGSGCLASAASRPAGLQPPAGLAIDAGIDARRLAAFYDREEGAGRTLTRDHWCVAFRHPDLEGVLALKAERARHAPLYLVFEPEDGHAAVAGLIRRAQHPPGWHPALQAGVRSHCPLLSAERSSALMPFAGTAVPAGSAWLPISLDLSRFSDSRGRIDERGLDRALDDAVAEGDTLIDAIAWSSAIAAEDARLNRRLAIRLEGVGDLVRRRGSDPSSLATLRSLNALLAALHAGLWRRSAALARERGLLPALKERQPRASWRNERHRLDWAQRWRAAVRQVQVRNRNLLVLTADMLLPGGNDAHPGYADLMPLLAHGDALGFALRPLPACWRPADHRYFYARLQAQVMRLNATSFIAIGA